MISPLFSLLFSSIVFLAGGWVGRPFWGVGAGLLAHSRRVSYSLHSIVSDTTSRFFNSGDKHCLVDSKGFVFHGILSFVEILIPDN
jgi:hypothetical protein